MSCSTVGAERWIGQRSRPRSVALVDRLAEQVEDAPERDAADRHGDRAARVDDLGAAAMPSVESMARARTVVAEVLLDLADEVAADVLVTGVVALARDDEGRVDLRQLVRGRPR